VYQYTNHMAHENETLTLAEAVTLCDERGFHLNIHTDRQECGSQFSASLKARFTPTFEGARAEVTITVLHNGADIEFEAGGSAESKCLAVTGVIMRLASDGLMGDALAQTVLNDRVWRFL